MNIQNWFTGVIEDVNDPMQLGRVRVRCFSYHSPSPNDIPTQDLPWATCIMPVTSPGMSGIGQSPVGLMPGSWVFGFFRDGAELQDPVILGSIPSTNGGSPTSIGNGFADPYGSYPTQAGPDNPLGATTYGFGQSAAFNNQASLVSTYNSVTVGAGSNPNTLLAAAPDLQLNGTPASIIAIARSQLGVVENSQNQGAGIAKYWAATDYKSGYNDRAPWCAAFVSWCIQQSGIFDDVDRPKSASAFKSGGYEAWARSKSPKVKLTLRPTSVKAGDLVIFGFSHIGIATTNSDPNGKFTSIDGNTFSPKRNKPSGVWEKNRSLPSVRSTVTIG